MHLSELRAMHISDLVTMAQEAGVEKSARLRKQELLFAMLKLRAKNGVRIYGEGTLEALPDGYGFLRYADQSYVAGLGDIYVSPQQIRRLNLSSGDSVAGLVRTPRDNERYFSLLHPDTVNGVSVNDAANQRKILFENLTPLFPNEPFRLERDLRAEENITGRMVDIIAPIGKGQRGLLVASPKSGKTVILQHIAKAIEENYPDVCLIVLLIDERPEEVTEMTRSVRGDVISSTFDEAATRHVQVAEMVIERAKRLVEARKDVVILLDSITRLARAYNSVQPSSGRVLSGGVDAQALQRPKRFFGAARNIEEGGSLTIIATALVETGSKMDEVIYEEFKGTGNMEIHLDRRIAEKRVYPALQIARSSTRREELLLDSEVLKNVWVLRKALATMDDDKACEFLLDRMRQTKTNEEFFNLMKRGI
ncbi:transcription termination factor Rho [Candidatus Persebacteraceae bacterium Df01]|uniref:Transcription termination factor Rho n=1 Tax=Candidatus Doriopsillibacter californiensis TaxID=2970740 RepID=A0ABT7QMM2_9GAMM|nr:transcription termination factor Rho [Candidatus Persebacteraceae bacterium Df01]